MGKDFRGSALMDLMEKSNNLMESFDKFSTTRLLYKLLDNTCLDETGKIKEEIKYYINIPAFKIQNSKFIPKPEDKFETMLFLPLNPQRKAEGGLRTKGFFKFSYKLVEDVWYICDLDGNPVISAPEDLQNKIRLCVSDQSKPITYLPLITVITVVLNGEKTLEETIKSVISQTYPNVEYIIIDGGSKDRTLDIIKKYEDYIDYWVSEPDDGIYDAMNKGLDIAIGNFIYFLGAGDILYDPTVFSSIFIYCDNFGSSDILIGDIVYSNGRFFKSRFDMSIYYKNTVHHQGAFYHRKVFKNFRYQKSYLVSADYELNLMLFCCGSNSKNLSRRIAKCDIKGISNQVKLRGYIEEIRIRHKYLGNIVSIKYDILTLVRYLVKKLKKCIGI
jgi:hypothetical protein